MKTESPPTDSSKTAALNAAGSYASYGDFIRVIIDLRKRHVNSPASSVAIGMIQNYVHFLTEEKWNKERAEWVTLERIRDDLWKV